MGGQKTGKNANVICEWSLGINKLGGSLVFLNNSFFLQQKINISILYAFNFSEHLSLVLTYGLRRLRLKLLTKAVSVKKNLIFTVLLTKHTE